MTIAKTTENEGFGEIKFTPEIQAAVKAELGMMLAAPYFAQSSRCKKFLSHIVQQTLLGNARQLKERTIGISVFDRANDYDTGEDAIVRVTANEVRKRIGQFYQESRAPHPLQIDLPRGSYVPEFRIHVAGEGNGQMGTLHAAASAAASDENEQSQQAKAHAVTVAALNPAASGESTIATASAPRRIASRGHWLTLVLFLLILSSLAVLAGFWRSRTRNSVPNLWNAFLESRIPILVCLGTHDITASGTAYAAGTEDVVMRKETIPIDDISVVTSMARLLGSKGIRFSIAAADQTSLTELQAQPVILLGAVDNRWTLQLTQALRYRIAVAYPLGSDKPPVASIEDAEHPTQAQWRTDFSVPLSAWKYDYAIVAREDDATIGVPVLIEAGLGNTGSLAASELLTTGALPIALQGEPTCRGKFNFEAVIATEIIGARPGPPHILRIACW